MRKTKIHKKHHLFGVWIAVLLLSSCVSTKKISDDRYLLNRNTIRIERKIVPKEEVRNYIRQRPNKRIFGFFRFHMGLYNLAGEKDRWYNRWLKNIGEEPVVFDEFLAHRSVDQIWLYMQNKGYRDAKVKEQISYSRKKVSVKYFIEPGTPYRIHSLRYQIRNPLVDSLIRKASDETLLQEGNLFDVDVMDQERTRVENLLRKNGFFNFNKEMVRFQADTSSQGNIVDVTMIVGRPQRKEEQEDLFFKQYRIRKIYVHVDYNPKMILSNNKAYLQSLDTLIVDSVFFIYRKKMHVKPVTILQSVFVERDSLYSVEDVQKTYQYLATLRVFRLINIRFSEHAYSDSLGWIDCEIQLNPFMKQSYSFDIEGTNTSGDLGGALNVGYQHKNLFRGAENLSLNLRGSVEALKQRYENQYGNTIELGSEIRVRFPKFMLPFRSDQFVKRYNPQTQVVLSYNYQQRPDYTRTIAKASYGYTWRSASYFSHVVNPLELSYVNLPPSDQLDNFLSRIRQYPYIVNSYKDHLITVSNYSLIFNNQDVKRNQDFVFSRLNLESSGNLLSMVNEWTDAEKIDGRYRVFGTRYSQYLKSDIDFRYYHMINSTDRLVSRIFVGAGIPYNNSEALPFEKKYFSGGSNSLRAWQVRTLGPGSFSDTLSSYPNSLGDIKLELNMEYRFDLFWLIKGAFFVDAGNIWEANQFDDRPGATFDLRTFYKDIAIGSGFGLRFDFSFFVFRTDLGLKFRDPMRPSNERWIPGNKRLRWRDDYNLVLGIGYPF